MLNSITLSVMGSVTVPTVSVLNVDVFFSSTEAFQNKVVPGAGTSNVSTSKSSTDPLSLLAAESVQNVEAYVNNEDSDFTSAVLNVALTYNYTPITPVANTPEPSSIALLGTGLLGVAGMLKRRFA